MGGARKAVRGSPHLLVMEMQSINLVVGKSPPVLCELVGATSRQSVVAELPPPYPRLLERVAFDLDGHQSSLDQLLWVMNSMKDVESALSRAIFPIARNSLQDVFQALLDGHAPELLCLLLFNVEAIRRLAIGSKEEREDRKMRSYGKGSMPQSTRKAAKKLLKRNRRLRAKQRALEDALWAADAMAPPRFCMDLKASCRTMLKMLDMLKDFPSVSRVEVMRSTSTKSVDLVLHLQFSTRENPLARRETCLTIAQMPSPMADLQFQMSLEESSEADSC